jgi:hypothetical protein
LQAHRLAGEVYHAHIKPTDAFHAYHITFLENMGGGVTIKILPAAIIKTYFHHAATAFGIAERQIGQPVVHIQTVTSSRTATAVAFATRWLAIRCRSAITTSHIANELTMNKNAERKKRVAGRRISIKRWLRRTLVLYSFIQQNADMQAVVAIKFPATGSNPFHNIKYVCAK